MAKRACAMAVCSELTFGSKCHVRRSLTACGEVEVGD